jgi:type II secretory pathway pseudopilin PulG
MIELLVVIAVIGILITMLVPQLSRARRSGKTAVSISNLRQIYIGLISYVDSSNGYFCKPSGNAHPYLSDVGANYNRLIYENLQGELFLNGNTDCKAAMKASNGYMGVMYCPVIRDLRGPVNQHVQGRGDYSVNRYFAVEYRSINIASIEGKKEPFMVPGTAMPSTQASSSFSHGNYDPDNSGYPAYVYGKKTITMFIGGDIRKMSLSEGSSLESKINNRNSFE